MIQRGKERKLLTDAGISSAMRRMQDPVTTEQDRSTSVWLVSQCYLKCIDLYSSTGSLLHSLGFTVSRCQLPWQLMLPESKCFPCQWYRVARRQNRVTVFFFLFFQNRPQWFFPPCLQRYSVLPMQMPRSVGGPRVLWEGRYSVPERTQAERAQKYLQ